MDILTLNSKEKLGCKMCDKCCIYRGDIRLTPLNVCKISKFLGLSINDFLNKYTDRLENNKLEMVLKTVGNLKQCILYDEKDKKCKIHAVKPMQCVMFPLVPENLKRNYFYNSEQCKLEEFKEIKVKEWLNGNNNIYSKNKKICMEWIEFLEYVQPKIENISNEKLEEFYKILFENYNLNKLNLKMQMRKNMKKVKQEVMKK